MRYLIKILVFNFTICLLLGSCNSDNCENKSHDCQCVITNDFPEIAEIIDSLKYSKDEMHFCRYSVKQEPEITLKGQTETKSNGYFYNDSITFNSLTIHKFHFYNEYEKAFLFDLVLYEFDDRKEARLFSDFKESISRDLSRHKQQHSFIIKNGKHIMYYEGFP